MRVIRRRKVEELSSPKVASPISLQDRQAQMWSYLEERVTSTVSKEKLELLYHIDGLTFLVVNDYITYIVKPGFYFVGDNEELIDVCEEWAEDVHLLDIMEEIVRDILVTGAGNGWCELGYTEDSSDIVMLRVINPKTNIDYIRDPQTKSVLLDESFRPVGFRQEKNIFGEAVEWRKDRITKDGKVVWRPKRPDDDGRDRIAHFKLFGLGESYLGQSPLEAVYKQAIIRLNLEELIGEGSFRSGGIVAYVGESGKPPVPDAEIDKIVNALRSVTTQTIFGFRHNVRIERFPAPDLRDTEELARYFAAVQTAGMGAPLGRYIPEAAGNRRVLELLNMDFEFRMAALQDKLASQMREKLFYRMLKARGLVKKLSEVPKVVFRKKMPITLGERSSTISRYARRGLMTWDPELEKEMREELGLPTTFVEEALKEWREKGRTVAKTKNVKEANIDIEDVKEAIEAGSITVEELRELLGEM